ncbi:MAG: bacitracin transporter permease [Paenibacillaceae bacterium]|jgi:bacitracin transport system permease protein|nr:bacitracin transporter permease [Paenibacillaceae bacterium]
MSIHFIILRNLKKNLKNYYLYVFALVFGVALYFSFVTLQYDPSMDEMKGTVKGGAAIGASSVLLVAIVAIFLLYANTIFIKRRSREIGLFQLIGLTKGRIFRLLSAENLILYFGAMVMGIAAGFAVSRLILMILFRILDVEAMAKLRFSPEALLQSVIVFAAVYLLIMAMNYIFIWKQSILSLFGVNSAAQERVRRMPVWQIIAGLLGLGGVAGGYYVSGQLFSGKFTSMNELMMAMILILGLVIIGTYLFYKGSVTLLFNAVRRGRNGYLSINEVLSLSSIMFRMKSNALLLTIITTVSALSIGLLSLSYISYYSIDSTARDNYPHHFGFGHEDDKEKFVQALSAAGIAYSEVMIRPLRMDIDAGQIIDQAKFKPANNGILTASVISDLDAAGMDLRPGEARLTGYNSAMTNMLSLKEAGEIGFITVHGTVKQQLSGLMEESVLPVSYRGGIGVLVVDETVYRELAPAADPKRQQEAASSAYYGIELTDSSQQEAANRIYTEQQPRASSVSQYDFVLGQRSNMGLIMFIVGFLGLTFLITSGCILYFKQMDEGEEEKGSYTILRKLGFTRNDLLRGIQFKQLFNFGIPLLAGLSHSYFAVKSGWFLFGTEMLAPMVLVMLLYTALYSIFGFLSVLYYKKVISESL